MKWIEIGEENRINWKLNAFTLSILLSLKNAANARTYIIDSENGEYNDFEHLSFFLENKTNYHKWSKKKWIIYVATGSKTEISDRPKKMSFKKKEGNFIAECIVCEKGLMSLLAEMLLF